MHDAPELERPRCPTHNRPLLRLSYQRRTGGRDGPLTTIKSPWGICPDCDRVFPYPTE